MTEEEMVGWHRLLNGHVFEQAPGVGDGQGSPVGCSPCRKQSDMTKPLYGCESWTVKKAERRRIDAFKLWFWRRLLRVPWTARRSNQSLLKEISPGCSLEGMMLT